MVRRASAVRCQPRRRQPYYCPGCASPTISILQPRPSSLAEVQIVLLAGKSGPAPMVSVRSRYQGDVLPPRRLPTGRPGGGSWCRPSKRTYVDVMDGFSHCRCTHQMPPPRGFSCPGWRDGYEGVRRRGPRPGRCADHGASPAARSAPSDLDQVGVGGDILQTVEAGREGSGRHASLLP